MCKKGRKTTSIIPHKPVNRQIICRIDINIVHRIKNSTLYTNSILIPIIMADGFGEEGDLP
jgi:hypothetical protein